MATRSKKYNTNGKVDMKERKKERQVFQRKYGHLLLQLDHILITALVWGKRK